MYLSSDFEWPDSVCWGGHITADTDIGGPGVMYAFLIQSWITVACGAFLAFDQLILARSKPEARGSSNDDYSELYPPGQALRRSYPLSRAASRRISGKAARNRLVSPRSRRAVKLLGPLCDLQIITSMGIMVAGFVKWNKINFYHEALVTCYWSLIFNSFCVIRFDLVETEDTFRKRDALRRGFVLLSCMLGVMWQILTYQRELDPAAGGQWDASDPHHCYLFLYESSPWFWIAGTIFFCIAVASSLTRRTAQWFAYLDRILAWAQICCNEPLRKAQKHRRNHRSFLSALILAAAGVPSIVCFVLIQSIAIRGYGDNYPPLSWLCYFLFSVWNTVDVISMWQLNKALLSGDESEWGFGQVLPLVMLLSVFFSAVDIWHDKTVPCPCVSLYRWLTRWQSTRRELVTISTPSTFCQQLTGPIPRPPQDHIDVLKTSDGTELCFEYMSYTSAGDMLSSAVPPHFRIIRIQSIHHGKIASDMAPSQHD